MMNSPGLTEEQSKACEIIFSGTVESPADLPKPNPPYITYVILTDGLIMSICGETECFPITPEINSFIEEHRDSAGVLSVSFSEKDWNSLMIDWSIKQGVFARKASE